MASAFDPNAHAFASITLSLPPTSSSAAASPSATSDPNSSSSSSGGDNGNNSGPNIPWATYLFAFLVLFSLVVLLLAGCATVTRRRRARMLLMRELEDMAAGPADGVGLDDDNQQQQRQRRRRTGLIARQKPVLWDAWVGEPESYDGDVGAAGLARPSSSHAWLGFMGMGEKGGSWRSIENPISATIIRYSMPDEDTGEKIRRMSEITSRIATATPSAPPSFWSSYLRTASLRASTAAAASAQTANTTHSRSPPSSSPPPPPPATTTVFNPPHPSENIDDKEPLVPISTTAAQQQASDAVRVSVMIAMPCPPHILQQRRMQPPHAADGGDAERELAEYQIGVLEVPWDVEDEEG